MNNSSPPRERLRTTYHASTIAKGSAMYPHVWLKYGCMPVKSVIRLRPTSPIAAPAAHAPEPSSSRASSQKPSAPSASSAACSVAMTA